MSGAVREKVLTDTLAIVKQVANAPIAASVESKVVGDLGFTSVQVLELVAELEDRFDIVVPLNDLPQIKTVGQIADKVVSLILKREEKGRP